jgi:hypothetical protein
MRQNMGEFMLQETLMKAFNVEGKI